MRSNLKNIHADTVAMDLLSDECTDLQYDRDIEHLRFMANELLLRGEIIDSFNRFRTVDKIKHKLALMLAWINRR